MSTPDKWSAGLSSADEEQRRAAVNALRDCDDPACLRLLEQALGDESWRVRKAAVEVIREFPDPARASKMLVEALSDDENAGRRNAAMEGLVLMGGEIVPYLLKNIDHPDHDVRKFIVDILGEIRNDSVIEKLLPLAKDPHENIRLAVVEAMGSIGGETAFKMLLKLLKNDELPMQFAVLHSLARIGKPIPMNSIRPLLDKKILRRAVFDALGQTKSLEAVTLLTEGLLDTAKSSRQAAVRAIHRLSGDRNMKQVIEEAVKEKMADKPLGGFEEFMDGNLAGKQATVSLLSMIGSPDALKILIRASEDDSIHSDVEKAVARFKEQNPSAFDDMVSSEPAQVKAEIIEVLKKEPAPDPHLLGPMEEEQFVKVRDLVSAESGLYYDNDLKYVVERRVQRRMEKVGLSDYGRYLEIIGREGEEGAAERRHLISILSTNETYFFREDFQLRAFREEILPALAREKIKKGSARIRIWSAGCSSGEEPYTIAILVKEAGLPRGVDVEITGSDISQRMIDHAREGLYGASSFRSTPDEYKEKYFTAEGPKFRISEEIRAMVEFDDTNLISFDPSLKFSKFDVIFCRNVIIYFSIEAKRKVVEKFYRALNPGGHLLLGHSESLMNISTAFDLVHLKHDLVYRKPTGRGKP